MQDNIIKDYIIKSIVLIVIALLHLSVFVYQSENFNNFYKLTNQKALSFNELYKSQSQNNEYYQKFGNKKFRLMVTDISNLKADFIYKAKTKAILKTNHKKVQTHKMISKLNRNAFIHKSNKNIENNSKLTAKDQGQGQEAGTEQQGEDFIAATHIGGYLNNPLPPYPRISRETHEQGTVVLDVIVESNGYPSKVMIVSSSGYSRLDKSAKTTVKNEYRFIPAKRLGVPLRSHYRFAIRFYLD